MKKGVSIGIIIGVVVGVVVIAVAAIFILGFFKLPGSGTSEKIDYSHEYPESASDISGFEMKKTGETFIVYYHVLDKERANRVLAVLEQAGKSLYSQYLGIEKNTSVYIASTLDEYVEIADFPGGRENVQVGDGSAPQGKIYLYKPFESENDEKSGGVVIHEGVHAEIFQFLGQYKMRIFPGFLNEGMAHYIEYVFKAGANFKPLEQIYHSDLLVDGVKTGNPKLMSLDELGQECDNYISDETVNFLCRGQGTFVIWYLNEEYGKDSSANFLADFKQTSDWKTSLSKITGKGISELGADINDKLKLMAQ